MVFRRLPGKEETHLRRIFGPKVGTFYQKNARFDFFYTFVKTGPTLGSDFREKSTPTFSVSPEK